MNSFTIDLFSNASFDVYPKNTLTSFSNFLASAVELEGDWEVALLEVSYPSKYKNITEGKFSYCFDKQSEIGTQEPKWISCKIPPGAYSVSDLNKTLMWEIHLKELRQWFPGYFNRMMEMKCSFKPESHKVTFTQRNDKGAYVGIRFDSNDLRRVTGTKTGRIITDTTYSGLKLVGTNYPRDLVGSYCSSEGDYPSQYAPYHTIMLYTDIIEYGLVGNVRAPLLRSFAYETHEGNFLMDNGNTHPMIYQTFTHLQYKRLNRNQFHSIRIELRSHTGELIPFMEVGITRLVLHFRRVIN